MVHRLAVAAVLLMLSPGLLTRAYGANLLTNGDFEAPAIVGPGQTTVPIGVRKTIQPDPGDPGYSVNISGVSDWTYVAPSDHGLARLNADFGLPASGQTAFINSWDRMMSQTVNATFGPGEMAIASIEFGTLGDDDDQGRAGRFYLVAGEASASDPDQFSPRSIILAELSVANPTWTSFTPDVSVDNHQYIDLQLSYIFQADDPALGLPLTLAFRTVSSSVGVTYWDNASLAVQPVPEPASWILLAVGAAAFISTTLRRARRCHAEGNS